MFWLKRLFRKRVPVQIGPVYSTIVGCPRCNEFKCLRNGDESSDMAIPGYTCYGCNLDFYSAEESNAMSVEEKNEYLRQWWESIHK